VPRDEQGTFRIRIRSAISFPDLLCTSPCDHLYSVPDVALFWAAQLWDRRFEHLQGNGQLSFNV
jgi:hypothetical protein